MCILVSVFRANVYLKAKFQFPKSIYETSFLPAITSSMYMLNLFGRKPGQGFFLAPSQNLHINIITLRIYVLNLFGRKPGQGKYFSP